MSADIAQLTQCLNEAKSYNADLRSRLVHAEAQQAAFRVVMNDVREQNRKLEDQNRDLREQNSRLKAHKKGHSALKRKKRGRPPKSELQAHKPAPKRKKRGRPPKSRPGQEW